MGNNVILDYAKPQLGHGCISALLHLWKSTDTIKYLLFLGTMLGTLVHHLLLNSYNLSRSTRPRELSSLPKANIDQKKNGDMNVGLPDFRGLVTGVLNLGKGKRQ